MKRWLCKLKAFLFGKRNRHVHFIQGNDVLPHPLARDEEEAALVVPHDLLNDAQIPMDAGLVVQTIPGAILIGDADPMAAAHAPLLELLSLFGISKEEAYKAIEEGGYYDE